MHIASALGRLFAFLVCIAVAPAHAASADDYPSRPIRIVVGFAAGGSADVMARIIAQKLTEAWGQPVTVENRPGASGTIGASAVAKATPDGYTLLVASLSNVVISSLMLDKPPYDPQRDFAPVTIAAAIPVVLVVHPSLPVNSLQELIAYGKGKPGGIDFLSGGAATATGMAGELFKYLTGLKGEHVPFGGDAPGITALLGGNGTYMIPALPAAISFIKAGSLKALGVGTAQRVSTLPQVPTIAEAGVPGYEVNVWNGVLAPAGTPREIVMKLNREIVKALQQPEVMERIAGIGFEKVGNTPEEFAAVIAKDMATWPKVIKQSGAKPN